MSEDAAFAVDGRLLWRPLALAALFLLALMATPASLQLAGAHAPSAARASISSALVTQENPELSIVTPPQEGEGGHFGSSVALSADGNTALIGAPRENGGAGAAWVFTRTDGVWDQTGTELTMPAEDSRAGDCGKETPQEEEGAGGQPGEEAGAEVCRFGMSVALSSDGELAVVGAPHAFDNAGAVWIFTRSGTTWTRGPELPDPESEGEARFGWSVAVSADAGTVLVGAPMWHGRAWVFTRSESGWTAETAPLSGGGGEGEGAFGRSVALSADGETALVGAPGNGSAQGAAWVFKRSGADWSEASGTRLEGEDEGQEAHFGSTVALSGDGETALVGSPLARSGSGAAWAFADSETGWREQGPMLAGDGESEEEFGSSVALSSDGSSALVGAPGGDGPRGAAWLYERSGASWPATPEQLQAGSTRHDWIHFGSSVALSATAETKLVGGRSEERTGAAWVFGMHPAVEALAPDKGAPAGGTAVTITGEHFTEATAVRFGSREAASFTVASSGKSISAVSPAGSGTVDVTVETPIGVSAISEADRFTYTSNEGKGEEETQGKGGGGGGGTHEHHGGGGGPGKAGQQSENEPELVSSNQVLSFGPVEMAGVACGVSLRARKVAVQRHGRVLLGLRAAGDGRCAGKLRLSVKLAHATERSLAKTHARTKTIGTVAFSIAAGRTSVIKLTLNAAGRALLKLHRGVLNASLLLVKSSPAPAQAHTARVQLRRSVRRRTGAAGA